ncbi:MAG: hypothetical protein ACYTHN_20795, partial [Planctomycetota bacterium]
GCLEGGRLTPMDGPQGKKAARRDEIARLLLSSAGRASLLEAAGPAWPEAGEPFPVLGEGPGEEMEEDATEETTDGPEAPPSAAPRGAVTVRYFRRMNPHRSFPLLLETARLTVPLRAVPHLPGCLCIPSGLDLSPEYPRGEFWVTPQALGPVPKAAVDLFFSGEKILELRTPILVRNLMGAWILLVLAAAFLLLSPVMEALGKNLGPRSALGALMNAIGGPFAGGIILSVLSFLGAVLWFFWATPGESRPVTVSLSSPFQTGETDRGSLVSKDSSPTTGGLSRRYDEDRETP